MVLQEGCDLLQGASGTSGDAKLDCYLVRCHYSWKRVVWLQDPLQSAATDAAGTGAVGAGAYAAECRKHGRKQGHHTKHQQRNQQTHIPLVLLWLLLLLVLRPAARPLWGSSCRPLHFNVLRIQA